MIPVNVFLEELIDYAGLFPPASLDLDGAIRAFVRHRGSKQSSALGRFVIPTGQLEAFSAAAGDLLPPVPELDASEEDPEPWAVSALVAPAADRAEVEADLSTIEAFNDRHTTVGMGAAIVDTIELKATTGEEIDAVLDMLDDEIYPYFELDHRGDVRGTIAAIAGLDGGAKVRTGGVTADAHPTVDQLADFILACRRADVPFKATAGLHHPVRARQESVGTEQFGFLNVFLGAALLHAGVVEEADLRAILAEESADAFEHSAEAIGWRGRTIDVEQLVAARSRFGHSFGSCSFDEPMQDLVTIGWLAESDVEAE